VERVSERSNTEPSYCYLCFNCGSVTPFAKWGVFHYTEDGRRRKPERNETDPVLECPVCLWEHIDDDGNPGILDGPQRDCELEREAALTDCGEHWDEVMAEVDR
jgi:hypothetical protein